MPRISASEYADRASGWGKDARSRLPNYGVSLIEHPTMPITSEFAQPAAVCRAVRDWGSHAVDG